jgi:hypothetical protein
MAHVHVLDGGRAGFSERKFSRLTPPFSRLVLTSSSPPPHTRDRWRQPPTLFPFSCTTHLFVGPARTHLHSTLAAFAADRFQCTVSLSSHSFHTRVGCTQAVFTMFNGSDTRLTCEVTECTECILPRSVCLCARCPFLASQSHNESMFVHMHCV